MCKKNYATKLCAAMTAMMNKITHIANEARGVEGKKNSAKYYIDLKKYEYKYLEVLKSYVPRLLKKEEFFHSAF